jgi:hypothetical protein
VKQRQEASFLTYICFNLYLQGKIRALYLFTLRSKRRRIGIREKDRFWKYIKDKTRVGRVEG